jgi:polysaccharide biosynthesis PFTS motif protein
MALRFTSKGSLLKLQQDSILDQIENMKLSKKNLLRDLALISFLQLNLFLALFRNRSKKQNFEIKPSFIYSLTPEQILSDGRVEALEEFLRESRFERLFLGKKIIIESKQLFRFFGQNNYKDLEIVFDTSIWIAKNRLSRRIVLGVIKESLSLLAHVLISGKQDEILILREIVIDEPVWRHYLKETGRTNIVTTQSHFLRLPYPFYIDAIDQISKSMLWYSTNSTAIENKKTGAVFDPEHYRLDYIDTHYVWTVEHKKYLAKYNPSAQIIVVGSILFKPKKEIEKSSEIETNLIVIFDVTPFNGLDVEVFYTREILTDFIQDLVDSFRSNENMMSAQILLKPKREYEKKLRGRFSPSGEYLDFIDNLSQNRVIEVLRAETDLYQLVGKSSLVVGIPFTSPVILAREMNVPCFYYVPDSAHNWEIGERQDGIAVIKGRSELCTFIQSVR